MPLLRRQAQIRAGAIDEEKRTVEACFSTGAEGRRAGWIEDYIESLAVSEEAVDLSRLNDGAALLNNHQSGGSVLENQLGVVEKAWIQGDEAWCRFRCARSANGDELLRRIIDREIRHISVGYQVERSQYTERENELDLLHAIKWTPHECSIVSVPFDPGANVRSGETTPKTYPCVIVRSSGDPEAMTKKSTFGSGVAQVRSTDDPADEEVRTTEEEEERAMDGEEEEEETTSADSEEEEERSMDDEESDKERSLIAKGAASERTRSLQIRGLGATLKLPDAAIARLIATNRSLAELTESGELEKEYKAMGSKTRTRSTTQVGLEAPAKRLRASEDALLLRMRPRTEMSDERRDTARNFRGMTLREMGRDLLQSRGVNTAGMGITELVTRTLHATSDFPQLLENIGRKVLAAEYAEEEQTFRPLITTQDVPDFKESTLLQVAGGGALKPKSEKGEYERGSLVESGEKYRVSRYGEIIGFSGEMMINDDLGAFGRVLAIQARRVRQTENGVFWDIFAQPTPAAGPLLADGKGIFHADRKNTLTKALSADGLSEARKLMRLQKDIGGDRITLGARYLVVPPSLETEAQKLVTVIQAHETAQVNIFAGTFTIIVEARLEDVGSKYWWMFAAPSSRDGVLMGGLEGESGPQFDTRESFDTDGVEFKVRLDTYAKAIDFRPFIRSTGVTP